MTQQLLVSTVLIERGGKYLLVQEAKAKAYKLWNMPGGHVEPDEIMDTKWFSYEEIMAMEKNMRDWEYHVQVLKAIRRR